MPDLSHGMGMELSSASLGSTVQRDITLPAREILEELKVERERRAEVDKRIAEARERKTRKNPAPKMCRPFTAPDVDQKALANDFNKMLKDSEAERQKNLEAQLKAEKEQEAAMKAHIEEIKKVQDAAKENLNTRTTEYDSKNKLRAQKSEALLSSIEMSEEEKLKARASLRDKQMRAAMAKLDAQEEEKRKQIELEHTERTEKRELKEHKARSAAEREKFLEQRRAQSADRHRRIADLNSEHAKLRQQLRVEYMDRVERRTQKAHNQMAKGAMTKKQLHDAHMQEVKQRLEREAKQRADKNNRLNEKAAQRLKSLEDMKNGAEKNRHELMMRLREDIRARSAATEMALNVRITKKLDMNKTV